MTIRKKRVLMLCTGNSARSQMAEGLLRHDCGARFDAVSAGMKPESVRPEAITVMKEIGIDIGSHRSKDIEEFRGQNFDFVITLCDTARAACPLFTGNAKKLHRSVDDPALIDGSQEDKLMAFRRVRDELREWLASFARAIRA